MQLSKRSGKKVIWNGCYLNGQHLTGRGYDVTADIIDAWLRTL